MDDFVSLTVAIAIVFVVSTVGSAYFFSRPRS